MSTADVFASIRASYDAIAHDYADLFRDEVPDKPLDRALFGAFADLVRAAGGGRVADVGCGPGHVTAHLRGLGLDAVGIDLSPGMVAVARRDNPGVPFDVGSMTALDLPDRSLGGVLSWYSIVNVPTGELPGVFAEFSRVLRPGGELLLACQTGSEELHATEWLGHPVSLSLYPRPPELLVELLAGAGLVVHAQLLRQPDASGLERGPRIHLMARRPADRDQM